jgi:hypothetical protein
MRTTVELPDELLLQAKSRAAAEGLSLRDFFIAAIRQRLAPPARKVRRPPPVIGDKNGPAIPDLTREQTDDALFG